MEGSVVCCFEEIVRIDDPHQQQCDDISVGQFVVVIGGWVLYRYRSMSSHFSCWPGTPQPRPLTTDDKLEVDPSALSFGIFRDKEHLCATTELLLAGVPAGIDLTLSWRAEAGILTFVGVSPPGGIDVWIEREFEALSPTSWTVVHQMFRLPDAYHSSGSSVRMMRGSVQAYDDLRVTQIEVNADVDLGGYVWAKIGFAPDNAGFIRDRIAEGFKAYPSSVMYTTLAGVAAQSSDDNLMYNLARALAPDGSSYGKLLLRGVGWYGHLDLTNRTHRQRLAVIF